MEDVINPGKGTEVDAIGVEVLLVGLECLHGGELGLMKA